MYMNNPTFDTMSVNHHVFRIAMTDTSSSPDDALGVIVFTPIATAD